MLNIKKIKPMFTKLVTTANVYEDDDNTVGGVITKQSGALKEYQTVVAIGSTVREIKIGDVVKINPSRFAVHKRDNNSVVNDMEGGNPVLRYKFDILEMDGKPYMLLEDRDIEYIIEDYEEVKEEIVTSKIILPEKKKIITD